MSNVKTVLRGLGLAVAVTAIGTIVAASDAHATFDADATASASVNDYSTDINNNHQNQGQQQGQSQGQHQGQNQRQGQAQGQQQNDNWELQQKYKAAPSAPSLAIGGNTLASSGTSGYRNGCGLVRSQNSAGGIGAGLDNSVVSGGILAYSRGTSQGLLMVNCEIGEEASELQDRGLLEASQKMHCLQKYARVVLDKTNPGLCDGLPVANVAFAWSDDEEDKNPVDTLDFVQATKVTAVTTQTTTTVQQTIVPTPVGNASNGRCTHGFDYVSGQCAKNTAFATGLREDG